MNNTASLKNSRINLSVLLSNRPFPSSQYHHKLQNYVSNTKVSPHLEWKPKSISSSSMNHEVSVAPSGASSPVDSNQVEVAGLSKKLSQANVSEHEHVIIPDHIRVPDSERTHLIFGTFESEFNPKASVTTSHTVMTKEDLKDHSPSSLTALNSIISTDVPPNDKTDHAFSHSPLPQSDFVISVSEHQQSLTEGVHTRYARYGMPFIDGETAQRIPYPSEVMGLHPANAISAATQQPVPQMYPQQFQVPHYPNFLPYRHVFSPHYVPPVVVPNYSSNPAFPQLPHASSYLVMPNGTSQLAANGMKYGSSIQYKQVFPGTPAGYGGYANHNGYAISTGVIGSAGTVEDANMSKYRDNNLYTPNPQYKLCVVFPTHCSQHR